MLKLLIFILGFKSNNAKGIDELINTLQNVTSYLHDRPCELSIFEKGSHRVAIDNKEEFTMVRQGGLHVDYYTVGKLFHPIYADKAQLQRDNPLKFTYHFNKMK